MVQLQCQGRNRFSYALEVFSSLNIAKGPGKWVANGVVMWGWAVAMIGFGRGVHVPHLRTTLTILETTNRVLMIPNIHMDTLTYELDR